jgi:phosphoenolpyruvate-protein kinase (PTS system EI component)
MRIKGAQAYYGPHDERSGGHFELPDLAPRIYETREHLFGGKPGDEYEQRRLRAWRILEWSRNEDNLKGVIAQEKALVDGANPKFRRELEDLTGHSFKDAGDFFVNLRLAFLDGSEQRWKTYEFDRPFRDEMIALDDRISKVIGQANREREPKDHIRVFESVRLINPNATVLDFGKIHLHSSDIIGLDTSGISEKTPLDDSRKRIELERLGSLSDALKSQGDGLADESDTDKMMHLQVGLQMMGEIVSGCSQSSQSETGIPSAQSRINDEGVCLEDAIRLNTKAYVERFRSTGATMFVPEVERSGKQLLSMLGEGDYDSVKSCAVGFDRHTIVVYRGAVGTDAVSAFSESPNVTASVSLSDVDPHIPKLAAGLGCPLAQVQDPSRITRILRDGDHAVFDGLNNRFYINPHTREVEERLVPLMRGLRKSLRELNEFASKPAKTLDDVSVRIGGIASSPFAAKSVGESGADYLLILRSEMAFYTENEIPNESMTVFRMAPYSIDFRKHNPRESLGTVARAFDITGDKRESPWVKRLYSTVDDEPQGVDFLLAFPEVAEGQVMGFMKTGVDGIFFPMISNRREFDRLMEVVETAREGLSDGEIPENWNLNPRIGIMVETPAAVNRLSELTQGVDFYKIGTNDLAHYTLGRQVRQDKPDTDPYEPSVFHNIFRCVNHGVHSGKDTGVCGDMAGRITGSLMLLGMHELARQTKPDGIDDSGRPLDLSMGSVDALVIKRALSKVRASDMGEVVRETLRLTNYKTTNERLDRAIGAREDTLQDSSDVIGFINRSLKEHGIAVEELDPFMELRGD